MIVQVDWDYGANDVIKKMTDEQYAMLRRVLPLADLPEERGDKTYFLYGRTLIDLMTDAAPLAALGIQYKVLNFKNTYKAEAITPQGTVNINIAIPNVGLMAINELLLVEDACTNMLQSYLDEGWRILAICPPNGVRRPDYILGRTRA